MIVRDGKNKILSPLERIINEARLFALAKAERKNSSEEIAEKVAELVMEYSICLADNKDNVIYVRLHNGQIFKLTVENLK